MIFTQPENFHRHYFNEVITARVTPGAPMPAELRTAISEESFYQLRKDCINAKSMDDFQAVIRSYNTRFNWNGAVVGEHYADHGLGAMIIGQILTLGGLFGSPGENGQRVLHFHLPSLLASAVTLEPHAPFVQEAYVSDYVHVTPSSPYEDHVPIAYATPVTRY
jgi:hypothetical protein